MKQFVRCTNCRQWYVQTFTTSVEISRGHHLRRVTMWCLGCIDEAEQRSQPVSGPAPGAAGTPGMGDTSMERRGIEAETLSEFQRLMQEHIDFMDRAIHEDEAVLVPLIKDFMQRCRSSQQHGDAPEQNQRLTAHLQYWEAFLKALNRA